MLVAVKSYHVSASDQQLLDPQSRAWAGVEAARVALDPTPLIAQPSHYIQAKWEQQGYGGLKALGVRSAHDGQRIYFHLEWADQSKDDSISDTDRFPDAAAVLFPVAGDAPLQSMGSPQQPVNAWYWRPDLESPYDITAQGTGTTRRSGNADLAAAGVHHNGAWSVVVRRTMTSPASDRVSLAPGASVRVAFAVWQGANQERGGLKAVTLEWQPLEIEA